jgi:hypothetical protein
MSNIPIINSNVNLKVFKINNVSFNKISLDTVNNLLYINASVNYIDSSSKTSKTMAVYPIYIEDPQFSDYINVSQLKSYITQLYGVIETTPPVESEYKYIPIAPQ